MPPQREGDNNVNTEACIVRMCEVLDVIIFFMHQREACVYTGANESFNL